MALLSPACCLGGHFDAYSVVLNQAFSFFLTLLSSITTMSLGFAQSQTRSDWMSFQNLQIIPIPANESQKVQNPILSQIPILSLSCGLDPATWLTSSHRKINQR